MSFPDMRGVVGGAHFTAASEHIEEERETLRPVSSHLSGSDVKLEGKRRQVVEDVMEVRRLRPPDGFPAHSNEFHASAFLLSANPGNI